MESNVVLRVATRQKGSKGDLSALRNAGSVPGVIYGHGDVTLSEKELAKYMKSRGVMSKVVSLCFSDDGLGTDCITEKDVRCIVRDVQYDPVTERVVHVDFQKVFNGLPIKVKLDVKFINEDKCVAIKRGAVINVLCHSIIARCLPEAIPEVIEVDVSDMAVGASLHIGDIALPEGVQPVDRNNFTLAVLSGGDESGESDEKKAADA